MGKQCGGPHSFCHSENCGSLFGDFVDVEVTPERSIILRPVVKPQNMLKVAIHAMLKQISPESLPDVSKFETTPVASELW